MKLGDFPLALWASAPVSEPLDTAALDLGYEVAFPFLADPADGLAMPPAQPYN